MVLPSALHAGHISLAGWKVSWVRLVPSVLTVYISKLAGRVAVAGVEPTQTIFFPSGEMAGLEKPILGEVSIWVTAPVSVFSIHISPIPVCLLVLHTNMLFPSDMGLGSNPASYWVSNPVFKL